MEVNKMLTCVPLQCSKTARTSHAEEAINKPGYGKAGNWKQKLKQLLDDCS